MNPARIAAARPSRMGDRRREDQRARYFATMGYFPDRPLFVKPGIQPPGRVPRSPYALVFYYNAMPERIRKDDSTAQKQYTWDGIDVVVEKNLANTTTQRLIKGYTPIAGIGPYLLQDLSGTQLLPLKNQVGTTQRETDTSGNVKNYYEYDAWGQPLLVVEATGAGQQYRFTGKELDPDNILVNVINRRYHFPYRTYTPFRGAFIQLDTLVLYRILGFLLRAVPLDSIRPPTHSPFRGLIPQYFYQYAMSSPTSASDPLGLLTQAQCGRAISRADKQVEALKTQMRNANCGVPVFRCKCCKTPPDSRGEAFTPVGSPPREIIVCFNRIRRMPGVDEIQGAGEDFLHEFIHAYDNCSGSQTDCLSRACSEVRAASGSGQCEATSSVRPTRLGWTREQCIRWFAAASLDIQGCMPGELYVDQVYEACVLDPISPHGEPAKGKALRPAPWGNYD